MGDKDYINLKEVIVAVLLSSLIFLLGNIGIFDSVRSTIATAFDKQYISFQDNFSSLNKYIFVFQNIGKVQNENKQLKGRIAELESEVTDVNVQLKDLTEIKEKGLADFDSKAQVTPVRVIAYDTDESGVIYINKGSKDNISETDIVVIGKIAIGTIEKVYENYSKVSLVLSGNYKINAISTAGGTRGIFEGRMPDSMLVKDVLNEKPVSNNDIFVTEGLDDIFPYGLYLGTVEKVVGNPAEPTKTIELKSGVDFRNLDRLYVMKFK